MYVIRDKKSGVYKYKREYPADLRDAIGKRWFVCSLNTKDKAAADKKFPQAHAEFEQIVEQYALHRYTIPRTMQIGLLPELKRRYPAFRHKHELTLPDLLQAQRGIERTLQAAMAVVNEHGESGQIFSSAAGGYESATQVAESYRDLLFRMDNAVRAAKGEDTQERMAFGSRVAPTTANAPRSTYKSAAAPTGYGPKLSEAFELWKEHASPQPKTIADWSYTVRRFTELYGDVHVTSVTKSMCREYRNALQALPLIKSHKMRALPIKELQQMVKAEKLDMRDMPSVRTINKMLDGLRAMIQTVIDQVDGFEEMQNPVSGLALKKRKKYNRVGFSEEDLKTLIASPLYSGCAGSAARNVPGNKIIRDGLFWIPLLSLFSGARQEEIAQLHLSDIFEDASIPHYSINAYTDNRRLKNEESQRLIPIHHELIKCGFLDYVRELRKKKQARVFPELQRGNLEQRYAKNFSKQFNAYLQELGIKPSRESRVMKDFHSYRHLFKTACRRAKIPAEFHHVLTGHVGGKVVGDDYGEYPLETSNECMQQVSFPLLDLSRLYMHGAGAKKKKRLILKKQN